MKTVFQNSSDIAHLFANQSQDEARTSNSNFYFKGNTIYSYGTHFAIAKHIEVNGLRALLFTLRGYSNTTSKHINYVAQATSHLNVIYCCDPSYSHDANFLYWQNECKETCLKLTKAKKPEIYLNHLAYINNQVKIYADYFSIDIPKGLLEFLSIGNKEEYIALQAKMSEIRIIEEKRKNKELKARHKKELAKWQNFEISRLYNKTDVDYLRIKDDVIQTTQAVNIPLLVGKKFYESIVNNTLLVGQHIQGFEVISIDKKFIKIGCHNFQISYLKSFGEKIWSI